MRRWKEAEWHGASGRCGRLYRGVPAGGAEQAPFRAEARARRADGEWLWVASYAEPRLSPSGEFLGHVGLSPDITERKQTELALQTSEEKFRQLAENIHEVFWMIDPAAREMLYVSPAYEQVWGRSCESVYRNPLAWTDAIHPDDVERARAWHAGYTGRGCRSGVSHTGPKTGEMDTDRAFRFWTGAGRWSGRWGLRRRLPHRNGTRQS